MGNFSNVSKKILVTIIFLSDENRPTTMTDNTISTMQSLDDYVTESLLHWTSPLGDDLHEYSNQTIYESFEDYINSYGWEEEEWVVEMIDDFMKENGEATTKEAVTSVVYNMIEDYCKEMAYQYEDSDDDEDLKL